MCSLKMNWVLLYIFATFNFTVASLNCRGINSFRKSSLFFEKIKHLDLISFQETHFKHPADSALSFDGIFDPEFRIFHTYALPNNSKTGVSIIINRKSMVCDIHQLFELSGRALGLTMTLGNESILCIAIYAPSSPNERNIFYNSLYDTIVNIPWYEFSAVILMGDFNVVENPDLDRSSPGNDRQIGLDALLQLKHFLNLHDVYRLHHPTKKDFFTFHSDIHGTESRLDRIYTTMNLAHNALSIAMSVNLTDHRLVGVKLNATTVLRGPGYFKVNTLLVNEQGVEIFIQNTLPILEQNDLGFQSEWETFKNDLGCFFQKLGKLKSKTVT